MIVIRLISRIIGIAIMVLAFLQWITFDYPDVNPFWPGAIFAPGMLSQILNWLLVSVIGAVGLMLFSFGKVPTESKESERSEE